MLAEYDCSVSPSPSKRRVLLALQARCHFAPRQLVRGSSQLSRSGPMRSSGADCFVNFRPLTSTYCCASAYWLFGATPCIATCRS